MKRRRSMQIYAKRMGKGYKKRMSMYKWLRKTSQIFKMKIAGQKKSRPGHYVWVRRCRRHKRAR